jgi:8-oxo-dGTP pyrophosphatase MutT (NUDIX family)
VTDPGAAGCAGAVADGAPEWLRRLATAAEAMEVPAAIRPPATGGRRSAVLVLFGEGTDGPDLLYIQRSEGIRRHAGQPAFPGGAIEESDASPVAAALREAAEETGVDPAGVDVLATLPELYVSRSEFRVLPVLAWWREPSAVRPVDVGEVAAVERISLAALTDPANRFQLRYPNGRSGPAFSVGSMLIWGFTGLITDRLIALGGWERPWDTSTIREFGTPMQPGY